MFSLTSIAASSLVAAAASLAVLLLWRRRAGPGWSFVDLVGPAAVVGLSVLVWRSAGNVAQLNDDPIPAVSPNDVLCPIASYVALGVYAAFRRPVDVPGWERRRAALTLISLVVNVVTI